MKLIGKILLFLAGGAIGGVVVHNITIRDPQGDLIRNLIIWAVLWISLGIVLYRELFGYPGKGYAIYPRQKYMTISSSSHKTITLENQVSKRRILLRTSRKHLSVVDAYPNTTQPMFFYSFETQRDITLPVGGRFHFSRQRNGYRISWQKDQCWREYEK